MFRKRKDKPDPSSPGRDRIDELANRLMKKGKIDRLEAELKKFDPDALDGIERESWYHLYGIVAYQAGNRALAFGRFREAVEKIPDSGNLNFSLGQEYEFRGETDRMFHCFDKALFPKVSPRHALAEARYAYLWSRTDKGWGYIEPLLSVYWDLKILDTTFLHIRGMPFFEETWAYLAAFSQLDSDFQRLNDLTDRFESECTDLDFERLRVELEAFKSGDFSALKEDIRSSIQATQPNNFPCGYQLLRFNILLAQEAENPQEALRLLDSVSLTADDFPWLDDMRLLAKCEQAFRFGYKDQETELRNQFFARQSLLFEPDHAINFNLLRYQERLKQHYRKMRQKEIIE